MKKISVFLCLMLLNLVISTTVWAQEQMENYFYPEGRSSYYIYNDENSEPVEKVSVYFEHSSNGIHLEEAPPIPLIGSIKYLPFSGTFRYTLNITNTSVIAEKWYLKSQDGEQSANNNMRYNLEMLKLPREGETINWTTYVNEEGNVLQIWEMSARRMMIAVLENGERIAVKALEVKRNVFDAQHNPIPGQSVTEYWQKGKGKIKVIRK